MMKKLFFVLGMSLFPLVLVVYEGRNDFDTYVIPYFTTLSGDLTELSAFVYSTPKYTNFLSQLSSIPPKTLIQQVLSPYRNIRYTNQGKNAGGVCQSPNEKIEYKGGSFDLTGYVMIMGSEAMLFSGERQSLVADRIYFAIKEVSDSAFFRFPFVKKSFEKHPRPDQEKLERYPRWNDPEEIDGYSGFQLGCSVQGTNTLRYLTQKIDTTNRYSIQSGSFEQELSRILLKSGYGQRYDIAIRITIDPNVFLEPIEYLPCNNPGISKIEILDASSVALQQPECIIDREGVCHPEWKFIDSFICDDAGGSAIVSDFFGTEKEYEQKRTSGRVYTTCSPGQEYIGHLSYDTVCCKGRPKFIE